jgi:exosome complex component RRP42
MRFSPAELSYLKVSLESRPPVRPDGRGEAQFRPVEATTDFLPTANGSARVRTADGGECIVGVKAKVVLTHKEPQLVATDVDVQGLRDQHQLPRLLESIFDSLLNDMPEIRSRLRLTTRYSYKLYIDSLIVSYTSHPLTLLSLAVYLAMMSTRLPLLVSGANDAEQEEVPVFDDDWAHSVKLCDGWAPPLVFLAAIVGNNVFLDPSEMEEAVAGAGVLVTLAGDKATGPLRSVSLGFDDSAAGYKPEILRRILTLVNDCGKEVSHALAEVVDKGDGSIF